MRVIKDKDRLELLEEYDKLDAEQRRYMKKMARMIQAWPAVKKLSKRKPGKVNMKELVEVVKEVRKAGGYR